MFYYFFKFLKEVFFVVMVLGIGDFNVLIKILECFIKLVVIIIKWRIVVMKNLFFILGCVLEFDVGSKIIYILLVVIFFLFLVLRMLGLSIY